MKRQQIEQRIAQMEQHYSQLRQVHEGLARENEQLKQKINYSRNAYDLQRRELSEAIEGIKGLQNHLTMANQKYRVTSEQLQETKNLVKYQQAKAIAETEASINSGQQQINDDTGADLLGKIEDLNLSHN